jgi:cytochrome c oxidase subunit 2
MTSSELPSILSPAGPAAAVSAELAWVLLAGGVAVVALIVVLAVYALSSRRSVRTGPWLIGGGIAFPATVVSALLATALIRAHPGPLPADTLIVSVTAHRFWWEIAYRDARGGTIVTANEIRIPTARTVRLAITSNDVIHSVWIPQLAGKVDAIPGRINYLVLAADRSGTFRGQCAEYCGDAHARMALHVVAMGPDDFDRWLAVQAQDAAQPTSERARAGREIFLRSGCRECHTIRGVSAHARRGPDLTHVAGRQWIGAGRLQNGPGAMQTWVANVQALKPGAQMPSFALDGEALGSLAEYLEQLE